MYYIENYFILKIKRGDAFYCLVQHMNNDLMI